MKTFYSLLLSIASNKMTVIPFYNDCQIILIDRLSLLCNDLLNHLL